MSDNDFMREMVAKARANVALNDGTSEPIKKTIAGSDLVLAIWEDPSQPHGFGRLLVKGDDALHDAIRDNPSNITAKYDAILCDNAETAKKYRQTLGEITNTV